MRAGLEKNFRRGLGALLLTGAVLVAGASAAAADHEVPDDDGYGECYEDDCYPTPTTEPEHPTPTTEEPRTGGPNPGPPVLTPELPDPDHDQTYPLPPPPEAPPGNPDNPPAPPVLARTGSNSGSLVGIGAAAVVAGAGLVVVARQRRLAAGPA